MSYGGRNTYNKLSHKPPWSTSRATSPSRANATTLRSVRYTGRRLRIDRLASSTSRQDPSTTLVYRATSGLSASYLPFERWPRPHFMQKHMYCQPIFVYATVHKNTISRVHTLPQNHPIRTVSLRAQKRRNKCGSFAWFLGLEALKQ